MLKQGRLGGPRRPKTVFDYYFPGLELLKITRYYFRCPPEAPHGPPKSPPKASGDPFWAPRGPRSLPEAENDPQMDPTWHMFCSLGLLFSSSRRRRRKQKENTTREPNTPTWRKTQRNTKTSSPPRLQPEATMRHISKRASSKCHALFSDDLKIGARRLSRSDWDPSPTL